MFRATIVSGICSLVVGLMLVPAPCSAAFSYVETVNGELSGNNLAPTQLGAAMLGSNTISGRVSAGDADIFNFAIPVGFRLSTIVVTSFSTSAGSANMFLSIDSGPTYEFSFEEINNQANLPNLNLVLGSALVGTSAGVNVGSDILDDLGNSAAFQLGAGFTPPLPAGTYSVYIQETGAFSNYGLSFNVTAVPEPSCISILGFLTLGSLIRRRRSCLNAH